MTKAYKCPTRDLLSAKLQAYGFSKDGVKSISSYLTNRTQKNKTGSIVTGKMLSEAFHYDLC